MFTDGGMARADGRLVKISSISNDVAECVWFDNRGNIHARDYEVAALNPFWLSAAPRTLWPEINEMPEELVAAADQAAADRRRERSRKPKPSRKLHRRERAA